MLFQMHEVGIRGWGEYIIVMLLWSEIVGGYNTSNTIVEIGT